MKYLTVAFFAVWSLSAFAEPPKSVEVRFCPASAVRTYPLESRRDLQSLLLQNAAVINHGQSAFDMKEIELELLEAGQVRDTKKLDARAIQRIADRGAKLQAAGVLQQVGFQFCGNDLIAPNIKLAGPKLDRDQALLIASQVFAFSGARDTLRVRVHGNLDGRTTEFTGSIPIKSEFAQNKYIFPLRGVWYAGWGASFHTGHRWAIPEEFALDIAKIGESGLSHKGDGTRFNDYYAYGADVLAAANGRVTSVANDQPEDPSAMQRPNESQEAYFARLQKEQAERLDGGQPQACLLSARRTGRCTRAAGGMRRSERDHVVSGQTSMNSLAGAPPSVESRNAYAFLQYDCILETCLASHSERLIDAGTFIAAAMNLRSCQSRNVSTPAPPATERLMSAALTVQAR